MRKIRILYVVGSGLNFGGIETFVMNIRRNINPEMFDLDLLITEKTEGYYDSEFISFGGLIHKVTSKKISFIKHYIEIFRVMKSNNYDIVHSHLETLNIFINFISFICNIKVRISHSHNTEHLVNSRLKYILHQNLLRFSKLFCTNYMACSEEAGKWLFGNDIIYNKRFKVIKNAIDYNKFIFNQNTRNIIREQLRVEDSFVIGHVGRLDYQKNQDFLIDIFIQIYTNVKNIYLILVGNGPDFLYLKEKINNIGLNDRVIFLGEKPNVNEYYNAFDIFCFPSNFEGLGISLIEAQVNGLSCIVSNNVPKEAVISKNIEFLNINTYDKSKWVEVILDKYNCNKRELESNVSNEYSIQEQVKVLEKKYLGMIYNEK